MMESYTADAPSRDDVDAMQGPVLVEFGTPWCGWCRGAQPLVKAALSRHPDVKHIKVEDGPGRSLGRSFRVKLWPTFIFMKDGREVARVTRPGSGAELEDALKQLA
jgi:thioredoxin 1